MGSTQPMWVGLDLCDEMGWVEFFLTYHGRLGQKISLTDPTWPMHTPSGRCDIFFSAQFNNNSNKKNCPTHGFNPIQRCGLNWTYVMS